MRKNYYAYFFWAMNIAALIAVAYLVYYFISITNAITQNKDPIHYDSGTYILILLTVFWLLTYIEYVGLKKGLAHVKKYITTSVVLWLSISVLIAFLIPKHLENRFKDSGYQPCPNPAEISRISPGESLIYKKGSCE